MVRQTLVQPVADDPPDRDVGLSFPHQPAVVHDAEQKAGEHQPHRHLRIDARTAVVRAVAVRHFLAQPPKVENTIHAGQDMILGHQLIERAGNEQFQLIATLASQHLLASQNRTRDVDTQNHACQAFSTAP